MRKYYENKINFEKLCEVEVCHNIFEVKKQIGEMKSWEYQITQTANEYTIIFTKTRYFLAGVEREPTIFEKICDKLFVRSE